GIARTLDAARRGGARHRAGPAHAVAARAALALECADRARVRLHRDHHLETSRAVARTVRARGQEPAHPRAAGIAEGAANPPMTYLIVKWLHILSSTVLFGTGLGSAYYMFFASRTRDAHIAASVVHRVVVADWIFTTPTIVIQ